MAEIPVIQQAIQFAPTSSSPLLPEEPANRVLSACRRREPRHPVVGESLCFSIQRTPDQPLDQAECQVFNKSAMGFGIEYDQPVEAECAAKVSYLTPGRQRIEVDCTVRHCTPLENGRFMVGLKLARPLNFEEKQIMRGGIPWQATFGFRPRPITTPAE